MASNILISYDLADPDKNFEPIAAEIQKLGTWAQMQPNLWYVHSAATTEQIADNLAKLLGENDSVLVVDASTNAIAWRNINDELSAPVEQSWNQD